MTIRSVTQMIPLMKEFSTGEIGNTTKTQFKGRAVLIQNKRGQSVTQLNRRKIKNVQPFRTSIPSFVADSETTQ
jgi:hypothetical protein